MPKDSNNRKFDIKQRLKTAELSEQQIETVLAWLEENEDKKLSFVLKFDEEIGMRIENKVYSNKKDFDIQSWAWQKIKVWMEEMGQ